MSHHFLHSCWQLSQKVPGCKKFCGRCHGRLRISRFSRGSVTVLRIRFSGINLISVGLVFKLLAIL
ncbi:hypothetical protein L873DRAFT_48148 [Choiromyces venosus 120613-1]|uniref:Uncharacterized protein n=1 Tax=Choiromyces venosus 120613-1 TaxID=1336337 RepID=A0A3N4K3H0_9PEZI|nr:hypothetical protein L873DRAFT_48148 [Choiromyces venosus 120613-1]